MRSSSTFTAIALLTAAVALPAHAQVVTEVRSGNEVVVEGLGKLKLLGIEHTDPSAFGLARNSGAPARSDPENQAPPIVGGGSIRFKRERPARDLLRELVLGKHIRVEYDALVPQKDRAYLFVEDTLVNAEMVRRGRARVDTSRVFAHQQEFLRLEKDAKSSGVGAWTNVR